MNTTFKIPTDELTKIRSETDAAIKRGFDAAQAEWRIMALECLYDTCLKHETFTVNDFRNRVLKSNLHTHDNRAMGGVMMTGKSLGWIVRTGESIPSRVGHFVHIQIWKSKIFERRLKQVEIVDQTQSPQNPVQQEEIIARFPSRTRQGIFHNVTKNGSSYECDCESYNFRKACVHVASVVSRKVKESMDTLI